MPPPDYSEVIYEQRREANRRQRKAGLSSVCKTDFRADLPPEIDSAMNRIWALGNVGNGFRDMTLAKLYSMISRGLASMTTEDVIRLANMNDKQIREAAPRLAQGKAL